jgi:diaminopimelate decarboxylase
MAIATSTALSPVFPADSAINERGRVEVGGCDVIELAAEFGTPAYVVAEEDLRARARAFLDAGRRKGHEQLTVAFAAKAFPCSAVLRVFAEEELWCDVASEGELRLAIGAGFDAQHLLVHGNAKSTAELRTALERGVGLIVIDNFDEIERLRELIDEGALARRAEGAAEPQGVLIRVTPDVSGKTHAKISTGQADSKFGFAIGEAKDAIARVERTDGLELRGIHAHIGSQLVELEPFRRTAAELGRLGTFPAWDLGGGLGVAYTSLEQAPSIEQYVATIVDAAREHLDPHRLLLIEPGRALTAPAAVTLYTVQSIKRNLSTWVAVDGGMSDNLRPMLYGAEYEAVIADRVGGEQQCVLAGKHCESGDVIVERALLDDPRVGDVVVTPVTGAYTYVMANNYNGVPRPPVIFCKDRHARVVVRRESFADLAARDVG